MPHPPATLTQHRLLARLCAAIYGIVHTLLPVVQTITHQYHRPYKERETLANRFSRIIQDLLALTARARAHTLTLTPEQPDLVPAPTDVPPRMRPYRARAPRIGPAAPYSARQLALRLACLLQRLVALVHEANALLPDRLRRFVHRACRVVGCDNPLLTWETAG